MDLDGRQPEKLKKPYPSFSQATAHHRHTHYLSRAAEWLLSKALHLTEATLLSILAL